LISWSRYNEQLESWFSKNLDENWTSVSLFREAKISFS
jgi:vacuolar-type H+-ATPase catalytic subunit A/Vma1